MTKCNEYIPQTVSYPGLILREKLQELQTAAIDMSKQLLDTVRSINKGRLTDRQRATQLCMYNCKNNL